MRAELKVHWRRYVLSLKATEDNKYISRSITRSIIWLLYIQNLSLQAFSQDHDLVSHTIYVVCVNFIHNWWDLQFKVDSERQLFEKLFTLRAFVRNLLRGSRRWNIFFIYRLVGNVWPDVQSMTSRLISPHIIY